jgi:hypothetical protein
VSISHDIIYEIRGKKNWVSFTHFVMYIVYKLKTLPKKFLKLKKEAIRIIGKVTLKLEFEFKVFYTLNKQHALLHIKIW